MEGAENKEVTEGKTAGRELKIGKRKGQRVLTKYDIMGVIDKSRNS